MEYLATFFLLAFGVFAAFLTFKAFKKNSNAQMGILAPLALIAFMATQGWVQGFFKTGLLGMMRGYGDQLNKFQATVQAVEQETRKTQGTLVDHQKELQVQQKSLAGQQEQLMTLQASLLKNQKTVNESIHTAKTDIENARKEIEGATTEIERQKKELSDVQYLVRNLFNKTETEKFEGIEQGRLFIYELQNEKKVNKSLILFALKKVPIKSSVRLQYHIFSQPPGSYFIANNLILFVWGDSIDAAKSKPFYVEYVADPAREGDAVKVASFDGGNIGFSSGALTDSFEIPRGMGIFGLEPKNKTEP